MFVPAPKNAKAENVYMIVSCYFIGYQLCAYTPSLCLRYLLRQCKVRAKCQTFIIYTHEKKKPILIG